MYSLVNIAVVVRDLARHPRAYAVATELLRAFALRPDDLDGLEHVRIDESAHAARRARALVHDESRPRALHVLAAARGFADSIGLDAYAAAADVLEQAPLGGLASLRRFVRDEVLTDAWTRAHDVAVAARPRALDIVADGIVGAHHGDDELAAPWRSWAALRGIRPQPTAWPDVVDAVRRLTPETPVAPPPAQWAARMHDACWAVHLTGRERDAAVTQLHALRAVVEVWDPKPPPLRVVSMTTAAVHATVVADVLDEQTASAMSSPLFRSSSGAVS